MEIVLVVSEDHHGWAFSISGGYEVFFKKNNKAASRLTSGGIRAPSLTVLPSTVMW